MSNATQPIPPCGLRRYLLRFEPHWHKFARPAHSATKPRVGLVGQVKEQQRGPSFALAAERKQLAWSSEQAVEEDVATSLTGRRRTRRTERTQKGTDTLEDESSQLQPTDSPSSEAMPTNPAFGYKIVDGEVVEDSGCLGAGLKWYYVLTRYRREQATVDFLTAEIPKLPPFVDENGVHQERKFAVWLPKRAAQAWNIRTNKMSTTTLKFGGGESVFLQCEMDNEIYNLVKESSTTQSFRQRHPMMDWVPVPCSDDMMHSIYDWLWEDHDVDEEEAHRRVEGSEYQAASAYLDTPEIEASSPLADDIVDVIDLVTSGKDVEENVEAHRKERERRDDKMRKRKTRKNRSPPRSRERRRDDARQSNIRRQRQIDNDASSDQGWFETPAVPEGSTSNATWDSWDQKPEESKSNQDSWAGSFEASWDAGWLDTSDAAEKTIQEGKVQKISGGSDELSVQNKEQGLWEDNDLNSAISDVDSKWGELSWDSSTDSAIDDESVQMKGEADVESIFLDKETVDDSNDRVDSIAPSDSVNWDLETFMDDLDFEDPLDESPCHTQGSTVANEARNEDGKTKGKTKNELEEETNDQSKMSPREETSITPRRKSDSEPNSILEQDFSEGDAIVVVSGPFQEFAGKVIAQSSGSRMKVELDVFGMFTTVEVSAASLRKKY